MLQSKPVKQLERYIKNAKPGFNKTRWVEAAKPRELFARSYAQYIATKSGDAALLASLESSRSAGLGEILHWNDEEFRPIVEALDQLFADLHWT